MLAENSTLTHVVLQWNTILEERKQQKQHTKLTG
jgi:hypothetical protein